MTQRRAQIVGKVFETARILHDKNDMFQDSETSLKGRQTKILIFGFRQMITRRDLEKLREAVEEENAKVESLGILPEKVGPTKKYTGVIEVIFSLLPDKARPAVKRSADPEEDEEDQDDSYARPKRRHPFSGQSIQGDALDDGPSLFSRLGPH